MIKISAEIQENTSQNSNVAQRINSLRVSANERRIAKEYVRDGERMADLICRTGANFRSAVAFMSRSLAYSAK
jgi:hypothetical protein